MRVIVFAALCVMLLCVAGFADVPPGGCCGGTHHHNLPSGYPDASAP